MVASAQACQMPPDTYLPFSTSLQCLLAHALHITRLSTFCLKLGHSSKRFSAPPPRALIILSHSQNTSARVETRLQEEAVLSASWKKWRRGGTGSSLFRRYCSSQQLSSEDVLTGLASRRAALGGSSVASRILGCRCVTDTWRRCGAASAASALRVVGSTTMTTTGGRQELQKTQCPWSICFFFSRSVVRRGDLLKLLLRAWEEEAAGTLEMRKKNSHLGCERSFLSSRATERGKLSGTAYKKRSRRRSPCNSSRNHTTLILLGICSWFYVEH